MVIEVSSLVLEIETKINYIIAQIEQNVIEEALVKIKEISYHSTLVIVLVY